jgi:hypothetical protein
MKKDKMKDKKNANVKFFGLNLWREILLLIAIIILLFVTSFLWRWEMNDAF